MDKLYSRERKILKIIINNYKKGKHLSKFDIQKMCKYPKDETDLVLNSLYNNHYFSYSGMNYYIRLTEKGLSYFRYETYDNIEICIKSLVFPVVVSFFTTLITMWLSH